MPAPNPPLPPSPQPSPLPSAPAHAAPDAPAHGSAGSLRHRVGEVIKSRYQILSALGGGSFGTVYRVRDMAVGVDLAAKEMHVLDDPATARDERGLALEWFKREALNLATVRHPHIPSAYFEQDDGAWHVCPLCGLSWPGAGFCPEHGAALLPVHSRFYLMMDFVDGPTLEEVAAQRAQSQGRPLDEETALNWIAQIANALRALHRVGIVHRDVKPENIKIRSQDNMAVLLDFGLTRKSEEASGYGTARLSGTTHMGTPGYAPPDPRELARPEARSDIYALGMALYRLVSGRDPQEPAQLAEMRAQPPRFFNAHTSPAVESIIARATQADRARRYASIDELLEELSPLISPASGGVAPFAFADGTRARTPLELARLLETHADEALNYGWNGLFEQWLLAGGHAGAASGIVAAKAAFQSQPERLVEAMRRVLLRASGRADEARVALKVAPDVLDWGVLDSGERAGRLLALKLENGVLAFGSLECQATESPAGVDAASTCRAFGFEKSWQLKRGGELSLSVELDTARLPNGFYEGELRWLDAQSGELAARLPWKCQVRALELRLEPARLDLGRITLGDRLSRKVRMVKVREGSQGAARGALWISRSVGPVVAPARVEGDEPWEVEIDAARREALAGRYEGALYIDTNGGRLRLPIAYEIVLPPGRALAMVAARVLGCAVGAGVARLGYALVNPAFASQWLLSRGTLGTPILAGYGAPMVLGALAGLLAETVRTAREAGAPASTAGAPSNNPLRRSGSGLGLSSGLQSGVLATTLGALLGWPLLWLGHWIFWGAGDWLLRPLEGVWSPLLRALKLNPDFGAPYAWGLAGAVGGLIWGLERLLAVSGKTQARYALLGVCGLSLFILLLNALLFTS